MNRISMVRLMPTWELIAILVPSIVAGAGLGYAIHRWETR